MPRTERRGISGRGRIAVAVVAAATLHTVGRAHRTGREYLAFVVAIAGWIGKENQSCGAIALREHCLDAAIALTIARDHDLSFDADTQAIEQMVIVEEAVVHINEIARDRTRGRIAVRPRIFFALCFAIERAFVQIERLFLW